MGKTVGGQGLSGSSQGGFGGAGARGGRTAGGSGSGAGTKDKGKPGEDNIAKAQAAKPSGLTMGPLGMGPLGGGTTTQEQYTPGAVGNFPDANAAAVADMLSSAIPGMGLTNTLHRGVKALSGEGDITSASNFGPIGDAFGADTGPQRGYQPDKYRGEASLGGVGGSGGAVSDNAGDAANGAREIAGQRFGAGTMALTGDPDETIPAGPGGDYSDDIMLRDRRKPRALGAGTQMLLGA